MVPKPEHSGTNVLDDRSHSVVGSVAARGRWPLECERPLSEPEDGRHHPVRKPPRRVGWDHDATVLEYFDQPPAIKLDYESVAGKRMGVLHTSDFFVIRRGEAGWEEWKTEEELRRLNTHNPNRYSAQKDGQWYCPPGMAYAERLGLYYRVRSSAEIDWVFQRNIQFLDDYLRCGESPFEPKIRKAVRDCVVAEPVTSLSELFAKTRGVASRDVVYSMIARGELHVDLR